MTSSSPTAGALAPVCPSCGTPHDPAASFCEACGAGLVGPAETPGPEAADRSDDLVLTAAAPQTAPAGSESPLDVGWTGVVPTEPAEPATDADDGADRCLACGQGRIVDGYCDHCGTPPPDPRDHFAEAPASWVAGVCDIGRRHSRNEDAMALAAHEPPGSRAVLVVCDGVSLATDSHIASLAAAREAREVLAQPLPRGVGTPEAWASGAARALSIAVARANEAVKAAVVAEVPNPPSCTFAAAVVENDVIVAGTVGDSRVYWLPDADDEPARQLGEDDSFANERIRAGVSRHEAENGPQAHSITRWLGSDAPEDLTPHLSTVRATRPGWLLVCSDGLWNYASAAEDLRAVLRRLAAAGAGPAALAQALVDHANAQGGRDNITVAVARMAGRGSGVEAGAASRGADPDGRTNRTTPAGPAPTGPATTPVPDEGDPIHGRLHR